MQSRNFTWAAGALYRLGKDGVLRRCVQEEERIELLEEAHEGDAGGHMSGEVTTRKLLQAGYWWNSMFKDAQEWVKECDACQQTGRPLAKDMGPLQPIQPLAPFMKRGIDFMGPFKNMGKYKYIVAAIDYVTKWVEAKALPDNTAKKIANFLFEYIISRFGCPLELVSDQGTHFLNEIVEALTEVFRTKHRKSTTYYPRCNGQAESTKKVLKKILTKMAQTHKGPWDNHLHSALFEFTLPALRTSVAHEIDPHANLQERLIELEKIDEQRQRAQWEQQVAQRKMKAYHDRQIRKEKMKEGDLVLWYPEKLNARKKSLTVGWSGPYIIVRIFKNGSVTLQDLQGMLLPDRVNRGKLKRYYPRNSDTQEAQQPQDPDSGHQKESDNPPVKPRIRNTQLTNLSKNCLPTVPGAQEGILKDFLEDQESRNPEFQERKTTRKCSPG
ncbi:hypothetical protein L7F22_054757 [Adiantum nelumboides]|nr:hypothetical protein [Adiantum nelumboides]